MLDRNMTEEQRRIKAAKLQGDVPGTGRKRSEAFSRSDKLKRAAAKKVAQKSMVKQPKSPKKDLVSKDKSNPAGDIAGAAEGVAATSKSDSIAGGMTSGASTGASIGFVVGGGPQGAAVGAAVGAVAGGVVGGVVGGIKAKSARRKAIADAEAQKQENLARIHQQEAQAVSSALGNIKQGLSSALQNNVILR